MVDFLQVQQELADIVVLTTRMAHEFSRLITSLPKLDEEESKDWSP